jgi:murein L,D-transpeptidase YcbB/YkuD
VAVGAGGCARGDAAVARDIRRQVSAAKPPGEVGARRWKLLGQIYADRKYRPLWTRGGRPVGRLGELVTTLCHAGRDGLRPADYGLNGLRTSLAALRGDRKPVGADLARLDLQLTARLLDYGEDLLAGRLDPGAVDGGWYIRQRRRGIDSTLRAALHGGDVDEMLQTVRPRQREYADLRDALAQYREVLDRGGWPAVPPGPRLRVGDRGERVAALKARLRATGDLGGSGGKPVFDEKLAAAVASFQKRHGIVPDSAVAAATLAALNVPVAVRIRQIELNLERYRWLPSDFGSRYILVNIPDYQLYAYERGKQAFTMRVIVGEQYQHATPVFADSMTYLVFRPSWNVPSRILVDEMIPRIRDDVYYLARNNLELVDTERQPRVLDPSAIDWSDVDTADLRFRVRQKSGSDNALGMVKFMFPNQFNIYLHDTPADELFDRTRRTLSHGCVRVEDPVKLAGYVLAGQEGWDEGDIREAMDPAATDSTGVGEGRTVRLEHPVPVYLVYLTAFVRDGALNFRDDPYGKDRQAMARLGTPELRDRSVCEELERLAGSGVVMGALASRSR